MITTKTLSTVCFLFKAGLRYPRREVLVRNLNSDVKSFFCQQVDVWTLLKITEKIMQRNVFLTKEKETGLSADRPSNNCAP